MLVSLSPDPGRNARIIIMASWCCKLLRLALYVVSFTIIETTLVTVAQSEPIAVQNVRVKDGDTIRLNGQQPDVRLVGYNAPETRRATCAAERALGDQATRRLRDLIRVGRLDLALVRCSCRPGTEGTFACNYGRACGILRVDGRDVGEILISENLAVRFECGQTGCPPTPKPWCR
jgi:endonuclease YncB( thermonuclease family)